MGDVQHDTANGETALGLHAIAPDLLVGHDVAVLGDVPRCAAVAARRVDGVGRRLDVDAVGPDGEQWDVEQDREDGQEDVEEPHCYFD